VYQTQGTAQQLQDRDAHPSSQWYPFINTVCQLRAYKYIHSSLCHCSLCHSSLGKLCHSSLGKLCWLNAGVEQFPPIVGLNSVRTTTLCRRDANNIRGISFGFLDQFVLFPVSEVMFQFPITSLRQDCRLRVIFKSPRVESLCAVPNCLPRCVTGATWGLQLRTVDGGDCREFFEQAALPEARVRFLVTRATTDARCLIHFCAFHGSC